jgi:epsilon-lactone hydrolase
MTQSIQSRIIPTVLRLMRMKQPSLSLEGKQHSVPAKPSNGITSKYRVSSQLVNGRNVWTIAPKIAASTSSSSHSHVLYLHGGSYVYNFNPVHWAFMTKLVDRLGCTVIAPDYPLAPNHQAPETVRFVLEQYRILTATVGAKNVTVMGDSAGAGLALVLAQQLRTANLEQPANLILLSPWLDLSMTNPGIQNADALDPMLSVSGLQQAARLYAGELSLSDPLVSPLYGTLKDLAPMTLFIGTFDVLQPDCQVLKAKAESLGVKLAYHEVERMVHVWMLLPMPEANRVMDEIVNVLERR